MKRAGIILSAILLSSAMSFAAPDYQAWISTEGAGIVISNNQGRHHNPPVPEIHCRHHRHFAPHCKECQKLRKHHEKHIRKSHRKHDMSPCHHHNGHHGNSAPRPGGMRR